MKIIETNRLSKTYRRVRKGEGLKESIRSLVKREYEEKEAVKELDLSVEEGAFIGLIGPNGAGKTTLTKMLTGIIAPTSGEIAVMGYYPNDLKNDFKRQYAIVMGQKSQLFYELTANDTLRLFKEIYGLGELEFQDTKAYFTELFGVEKLLDVQVRTLSLGERMKLELMAALIHNPRILFLDEPTIGLDAGASRQIRGFLRKINKEKGTTILLTSHYMEDIRALCDRCVVINHGTKIYDGSTEALFERYQRDRVISVSFSHPLEALKMRESPESRERLELSGKTESRESLESSGKPDLREELVLPEGAQILEDEPWKKVIRIPKEKSSVLLQRLMEYHPRDVTVEEDEIGKVVERIYAQGSNAALQSAFWRQQ